MHCIYSQVLKLLLAMAAAAFFVLQPGLIEVRAQESGGAGAQAGSLKSAESFSTVSDKDKRSVALFNEMTKVIMNPRCVDCHPAGDHALQGQMKPHDPPAPRGDGGIGVAGLHCDTCHTDKNVTLVGASIKSIPGHPRWSLAPIEMAWEGKSASQICQQIKDQNRNGGRDLEALYNHLAKDDLVGWAWHPGDGRTPVPGTQEQFGQLTRAWIDSGAACP